MSPFLARYLAVYPRGRDRHRRAAREEFSIPCPWCSAVGSQPHAAACRRELFYSPSH